MKKLYHYPENGEIRWNKYFAWLPTAVEDQVIWLRSYYVKERYIRYYGDMLRYANGYWWPVPYEIKYNDKTST